ncbi:glycosyltransferase [uncultured Parabacteroides sp.]|jgi:glycosyltransferase involved in cell wall biosynthesis|uniref:glycosyltransferase n=1 Tax=uncultured Parabacteroides sp. TaxID=512312 RepID=UPI0025FA4ADF|nr:glycosyltransferase [uncultured Parabacteroides sp.]
MKIIHVINSMSKAGGGPSYTTLLTLRGTRALGMDVEVLTTQPGPGEDLVSDDPFICYLPRPRFLYKRWGYTRAISRELAKKERADIYHIQGIWLYSSYIVAQYARQQGRPYLITLHGTLHPKALEHSSIVKKISLFLYQSRQLQQAACIHTTCMEEMKYYRSLGFTNPVAVVPCPMEICKIENSFSEKKKKIVGYLGRLHPVKRIDRLLEVWKHLCECGELLIMGEGEPDYVAFLKKEAERLQLSNIRFVGWVSGTEKNRLLASLTCLVVPSDFENFGMIVPEALLQEIPVIASTASPWQDLETYRCGWWVNNDVDSLTIAVRKALSLDEEELLAMGKRGRQLVLDKYSVDVVSRQMKQLYDWIVGQADKPEFVYE